MQLIKYKGKVMGAHYNATERRVLEDEIRKRIVEADEEYSYALNVVFLYTLHKHLGFGKKRLMKAYLALFEEHEKLVKHYEMPDDFDWLADQQLKAAGVDVHEWMKGNFGDVELD